MTLSNYQLVDPSVTTSTGRHPVEVDGVAEQLRRAVAPVVGTAAAGTRRAAEVLASADPQAWLFIQRDRYIREAQCDPYAEQMLRRMGLIPSAQTPFAASTLDVGEEDRRQS